jgi:hypothetical protein
VKTAAAAKMLAPGKMPFPLGVRSNWAGIGAYDSQSLRSFSNAADGKVPLLIVHVKLEPLYLVF